MRSDPLCQSGLRSSATPVVDGEMGGRPVAAAEWGSSNLGRIAADIEFDASMASARVWLREVATPDGLVTGPVSPTSVTSDDDAEPARSTGPLWGKMRLSCCGC